ncbi:MAG: pseudouridine synthase [Erysipelotrichaceae bacterium]|nr:pseudouridine synthase [Erysipelotrichaceae bacterium]
MRLDKFLSHTGFGTRKEVKKLVRNGWVTINGEVCTKDDIKIDEEKDIIMVNDEVVSYKKFVYLMMNKPAGYVSATEDFYDPTVMDLLTKYEGKDLFPCGRLDKDTEGLLLLTNDGQLAHQLLSPKHHVEKEYYVELDHPFDLKYLPLIEQGIRLNEEEVCAPAKITNISKKHLHLILTEGKFHQVKRMMIAAENEVTYLKRLRMGTVWLDDSLGLGEYRELTKEELESLQ